MEKKEKKRKIILFFLLLNSPPLVPLPTTVMPKTRRLRLSTPPTQHHESIVVVDEVDSDYVSGLYAVIAQKERELEGTRTLLRETAAAATLLSLEAGDRADGEKRLAEEARTREADLRALLEEAETKAEHEASCAIAAEGCLILAERKTKEALEKLGEAEKRVEEAEGRSAETQKRLGQAEERAVCVQKSLGEAQKRIVETRERVVAVTVELKDAKAKLESEARVLREQLSQKTLELQVTQEKFKTIQGAAKCLFLQVSQ